MSPFGLARPGPRPYRGAMLRLLLAIFSLLAVASCGRTLTPAEREFMLGLQGESSTRGRAHRPQPARRNLREDLPRAPAHTCRERIAPPPDAPTFTASTAGITLFQHLHIRPDHYLKDYSAGPTAR